jgi:hypothetical protein
MVLESIRSKIIVISRMMPKGAKRFSAFATLASAGAIPCRSSLPLSPRRHCRARPGNPSFAKEDGYAGQARV